jgi:hypothetical protein
LPADLQVFAALLVLGLAGLLVNVTYQVIRKPTELFFPISGTLHKTPMETWREYAPIFIRHSTATITPEFLAALAQVEGSGNPVIRTYWRFSLRQKPPNIYRPASSAVGMYQITDGTYREAKRYCIHRHAVVEDGPWHALGSCWFNSLYVRVVPSHAVEMSSALLDRRVSEVLERGRIGASLAQKQDLAAVIHLCGAAAGGAYARRGFQPRPGQRCGDHDLRAYLARIDDMKRAFARLAGA